MRTRQYALLAAMAGLAFVLSGCSSVSEITGSGKDAPDEFAVVTKQPLIIPPEFNLHPPRPGAAPINQVSPTETAQSALFPDDPAQAAASIKGDYSPGEKMLLANTGAANANDTIRQQIAADNKSLQAADEDFTNSVLFGSSKDGALDSDAEKARLDKKVRRTKPVASTQPARVSTAPDTAYLPDNYSAASSDASQADMSSDGPQVAGTLPDLSGSPSAQPVKKHKKHKAKAKPKKDDDGWLDGIF